MGASLRKESSCVNLLVPTKPQTREGHKGVAKKRVGIF